MRYNKTLNIPQIMMNASHALLRLWGAVQHAVRLYNLARYIASTVNPIYVESYWRFMPVLICLIGQYLKSGKCKLCFTLQNPNQDLNRVSRFLPLKL